MNKTANINSAPALMAQLKNEMTDELGEIVSWWVTYMPDHQQGGFYGAVDNFNKPDLASPKGIVLNSRILWAFSAASRFLQNDVLQEMAARAFNYIQENFSDKKYGGVYWPVDAQGRLLDGRKQIYGLAFCIYGLSEYYFVSGSEEALQLAKDLFECIEKYSYDEVNGGYWEAFTREWQPIEDLRLSEKDENESKTANTHLHVIEAYASLYRVWKNDLLYRRIIHLLDLFETMFIDKNNFHLHLFFDNDWTVKSTLRSYGHDIETAWLLLQCAEISGHTEYIITFRKLALQMTSAVSEGLDTDGGLWYEYEPSSGNLIREKHSWCQAEAVIGFLNAYQISQKEEFFYQAISTWEFVKKHIRDNRNGEWFWGVQEDYQVMQKDKAGFWKCPYHNSRACMEIINRIP